MKFTIQGIAKGKGRPRGMIMGNHVRIYTDSKTASYENLVRLSYVQAEQENYMNKEQLGAKINIYHPIPKGVSNKQKIKMLSGEVRPTKVPDIDNVVKSIFDGLNGVAYGDDSQIIELYVKKVYSEEPRVEVEIGEVR